MAASKKFPESAIIREIYTGKNAHERFEYELDQALELGHPNIIIEPTKLGEETARWVYFGNCLHKTSVLSGFGAVVSGFIWPDRPYVCCPFAVVSLLCTGLYTLSWQFDPCCKYQVEQDAKKLSELPLDTLTSSSPLVLVKKDDSRRKILHCTVTVVAVAYCGWRLYDKYYA